MAKPDKQDQQISRHGYQPITEGYQPGQVQPIWRGSTRTAGASETVQQAPSTPPSGGSSAAKPAQKKVS